MRLVIPWFTDKSPLDKYVRGKKIVNFFKHASVRFGHDGKKISDGFLKWLFGYWINEHGDEDLDFGYRNVRVTGFRLLGLFVEIVNPDTSSWYTCDCGHHPDEDPYYIDNVTKKFLGRAKFAHLSSGRRIIWEEKAGATIYPKYSDENYISNSSYSGYDWVEVHWCPVCKDEWEFSNSSY